jgi:hypothetical protein
VSGPGDNLALIVAAWAELLRSGASATFAATVDDQVVWHGVRPDLACRGREEVLDVMLRGRGRPPRITRMEAEEAGDAVVLSVEGPDFAEGPDGAPPDAPRVLLFTFRDGRVVRIQSLRTREAALG